MATQCPYCGSTNGVGTFTIMDGGVEAGEAILCDDCGRWDWE